MSKSKTKTHKAQHFVPKCYLRAWIDLSSVNNKDIEPYIWVFDKDGSNQKNKSPKKIFTETDIYTIHTPDGQRDLTLELGFSELENRFTHIRDSKLSLRGKIELDELAYLHAFIATSQLRTPSMRDFHLSQLAGIRGRMEDLEIALDSKTPEQRRQYANMSPIPSSNSKGLTIEDIKERESEPFHKLLLPMLKVILPTFWNMSLAILCTDDDVGFVTSDTPCVWYDPEAYKRSPIFRGPGLMNPLVEITLPISPSQCLLLSHQNLTGYIDVDEDTVMNMNRRQIGYCDSAFILNKNKLNPEWFNRIPLPEDAWEFKSQNAS